MAYRNAWQTFHYTGDEAAVIEQGWREFSDEYESEQDQNRATMHPAYTGMAKAMWTRDGYYPSTADVTAFVLEQVTITGCQATSEAVKTELRTIYRDIRNRGGDAYAEHKSRLQALNSK